MSVYKVIELIGSSEKSWEDGAKKAVELAAKNLKEIMPCLSSTNLSLAYGIP